MNYENAVRPCAEADGLKLVQSLRTLDAKQLLQAAIERGLTFGDCINAFAVTREESASFSPASTSTAWSFRRVGAFAAPAARSFTKLSILPVSTSTRCPYRACGR